VSTAQQVLFTDFHVAYIISATFSVSGRSNLYLVYPNGF
jgi:hypothetical protein